MVPEAGFEPELTAKSTSYKDGPEMSNPGLAGSKVGQRQAVTTRARRKTRTAVAPTESQAGPAGNTTGAQRLAAEGAAGSPLLGDLRMVVAAWPGLPEVIQEAILAMVRAVQDSRSS